MIANQDRLIVALDVPTAGEAKQLVRQLDDAVTFYKIGLELAMAPGYFDLLDWLIANDKKVFCDLKFYDIPATVAKAVANIAKTGGHFLTVHGDRAIMEAANANKGSMKVFAVTVLTSMDAAAIADLGGSGQPAEVAITRAKLARDSGCDGVICSGLEVGVIKAETDHKLLAITPGIRPAEHAGGDDQKRVVTAATAIQSGADYLVVGRPIHAATDPKAAAISFQTEIAAAVG